MTKILFLVSGNGGLLKFIYSCIDKCLLPNHLINEVISDRECKAIEFAKIKGISCQTLEYNASNRLGLLNAMNKVEFDVAITTIYKVLDSKIVKSFHNKLINVHPSLLPAFGGGLHAVEDAIEHGVKFVGTTVHDVNEEVDAGDIIAQSVMPVTPGEAVEAIINQEFRAWCLNLLNVLIRRAETNVSDKAAQYQKSFFNPPLCFDTACFDDSFWDEILRF